MCAVYGVMYATAGLKEVCARAVCAQHGALRAWDHESKSWSLRILAQAPNETALRRAHDGIMSRTTNLLIAHVHLHQNCQDLGDRGTAHADTQGPCRRLAWATLSRPPPRTRRARARLDARCARMCPPP